MKRIDFRDLQKYLHEIPNQFHSDELLKKIRSMDTHTAYALLGGYLAPLLKTQTKEIKAPKLLHLEEIVRANTPIIAHADLKNVKSRWGRENLLPQIERLTKQLIEKFKKFIAIFPRSVTEIDPDGHSFVNHRKVFDIYKDIHALTEEIRNLIGNSTVDWHEHPELRRKYSEILVVLTAIIPPWRNTGVLPLIHAKIVFKDIEKMLRELYESRSELEERALKDLQERLNKLTKDKNKEIGVLEDRIDDLKSRETSNKNRIATLEREIKNLEKTKNSKISEKDAEIAKLQKQITDLTNDKNSKETTIKNLRQQITNLQKQVTDLNTKKTENESTIQSLRNQITALQKQVTDLTNDKTGNKKTIDELNEQIDRLNKQVTDLTGDKTGNEKTIGELNKQLKELREKVTELEGKEGENTTTIAELTRQVAELEKDKKEKEAEISQLKKDLQEAKDDLTTVTAAKDAAIKELKKQIAKKNEDIGKLEEEITQLKEKVKNKDDLEQQLIELQRQKDELEQDKTGQITDLQGKLNELNERMNELEKLRKEEIEGLQKDLKKVQDELKIKEKEIKDGKIDEIGKELPDLQKLLKDLEDGGIDLKDLGKLRDKLDNLNRLTKDGKDAVNDLEDLQKNINELREELKKQKIIELEKQKEKQEIIDRENKLDELQRQILKIRQELKDLESLKGQDLTDLRKKLEELEKLKKETGNSKDKIKKLEDQVNTLFRELRDNKQKELDKQKEISDRDKEIERKKKEEEITKIKEIQLKELKKKREMMDAYVFMIVVFLTHLHTKQAEKLKTHGETLQKISRVFDQWNVIQRGLNTISQNANVILRWIKERKVDSNYALYTDSDLSRKETDPRKLAIWNTFKSFLPDLQKNVKELRRILDEVRPELPDSAKTLLDTMYKLSGKLLDIPDAKGTNELTSYLKVTTQSEGEIRVSKEIEDLKTKNKELLKNADKLTNEMSDIRDTVGEFRWGLTDWFLKWSAPESYALKQKWNKKRIERDEIYTKIDANKKRIQEKESELRKEIRKKIALPDKRLTILDWISDSDQTQFKAFMDNLAQGVTALTSISNMAQQELQIDTQYYNSLLGLQKAGMDSLTRTIQGIVANMR